MNFYNKFQYNFEIILQQNFIYLRIHSGKMFEARTFKNSLNVSDLYIYYSVLNFIIEIAESLNKSLDNIEL